MQDLKASLQVIVDAMEVMLSNILPHNWREDMYELSKEVVLSRISGEEWQQKLQNELADLKREFQTNMNLKIHHISTQLFPVLFSETKMKL